MKWEKPTFTEVNMSSEIGGYQEDDFNERNPGPVDQAEKPELHSDTVTCG